MVAFGPTFLGEVGLEGANCATGQHASCEFGWTFADDTCFKLFGDGILGQPLGWTDAEEACQAMGSQTHLASVTSEEQQRAVVHLASGITWIGLNDYAEEGNFVWSDDEPLEYSSWAASEPNDSGDGVFIFIDDYWHDTDAGNDGLHPYICAKKVTPVFASGGEMNGCTDGRWVIAGMDRNGLRPMRYTVTGNGLLIVGSETGMVRVDDTTIRERGRVGPGEMIGVDLEEGRFCHSRELVDTLAGRKPFGDWVRNITPLDRLIRGAGDEKAIFARDEIRRRQIAAGWSHEDLELILHPMVADSKEPIGAMGDDARRGFLVSHDTLSRR